MRVIAIIFLSLCFFTLDNAISETAKEDEFVKKGDEIALKLISALQKELGSALKDGGVVNAIEVCSKKAYQIAKEVAKESNAIDVKRISDKYRNPLSKPDETDMRALRAYYNAVDVKGQFPPYILIEKEKSYVYYKPIMVGELCLKCHGEKNQMEQDVLKKINELYPKDTATGYKKGDFRGLVRVELKK